MTTITAADLGTDATIIDVREPDEFAGARIARATAFLRGAGIDAVGLEGGITRWHRAGFPVGRPSAPPATRGFISLDNLGGLDQAAEATGIDIVG